HNREFRHARCESQTLAHEFLPKLAHCCDFLPRRLTEECFLTWSEPRNRVLQFHSFVSFQRISSTSTGRTGRRYWRRAELSALSHRTGEWQIQSQLDHIPPCPQLRPSRESAWHLSALPSFFLGWNTRA